VNRFDVWGGYNRLADRGKPYTRRDGTRATIGKVTTRPYPKDRGKAFLTPAILARHFAATGPEHLVGLHSTSPQNTSLWGAVDVDCHGEGSNDPAANLAAALAWCNDLGRRGFRPLLTSSNGAGGFHLRFLLAEPAPTPNVFGLLRFITADYARYGLTASPETFPKQACIAPGRYGNWLRIPGRHHSEEQWALVWDGARWLEGHKAIDLILSTDGDPASLVPAAPPSDRPRVTAPATPFIRSPSSPVSMPAAGGLELRIGAYLDKLPSGLGAGQHRDDYGYLFAAFLSRDLNLTDAEALPWMERWDSRNAVPKGTGRLKELLLNAHAYGQRTYGSGLHRPAPFRSRRNKHPLKHIRFTVEV
jgi:hypothetical protein